MLYCCKVLHLQPEPHFLWGPWISLLRCHTSDIYTNSCSLLFRSTRHNQTCLASRSVIQRAQGPAIHDAELVALVLAPRMQCLWGHSLHPVDEVNLEHQIKHLHPLLSRNPLVLGQEDSSVKLPSSLWLLVESRAIPIHSTVHERHCFVLGELAFSTREGGHLDLGGTVDCNAVRCIAEPTHQGKQRQRKPQVNVLLEGCNLIVPLGC